MSLSAEILGSKAVIGPVPGRSDSTARASYILPSELTDELPSLPAEALASYRRDGYIGLEEISPPEEVEFIRKTLFRLFEEGAGFKEGAQYDFAGRDTPGVPATFPSLHNPSYYVPELKRTLFHKRAMLIAKAVLGKDAALYGEHSLLKPAARGPATPWHQDEAFRSPDFEHREVSIWLALQPVDKDNGCMQFIPGSQKNAVLPHDSPGGDRTLHALECFGDFPADEAVPVPLKAGGCTAHDIRTLHHTAPNSTDGPRLAYILIFNVPPVYRPGLQTFPWQEGRHTDSDERRRQWRRKGGILVEVVRMLPRTRLTSPRWIRWALLRTVQKLTRPS
jgi:ectoine hydroxylase-related dioxygenase (phytanoyl-CoA dioxygenase family)